ncbi:unnamed protein product [Durusdinium trenchii]|uniref:Uncharacterized protein n=1 Tax=Durusdinium trenchii TaxID=1381693 RepID=A0ABP0MHU6_9DINO
MHVKAQDESEPKARRLQMIVGQTHGGIIGGSAGTVVHHYVDGSSAGGIVGGDIGTAGTVVHHYVDGSSAGGIVGGDIGTGGTVVHHYVDGSSAGGIVGGEHVHHVHVTHYTVPAPVPQPVEPQTHVHEVVRRHYGTVYRKVPVNHYVHVKMPQQPPIVHTVKVMAPAKTYSCNGVGDQPDPSWSDKHTRWCCYKYGTFCPKTVIDKNIYHTVVKKQPVKVPVPEPMPTHPPIVKTIHHTYHVPSPPRYVHVPVPGPTVVKNVVVPENVPVPVPEPPQVINVKKPYTVHVPGKNHYVHVPVPSPPHIVTKYHTHWNTVVDHGDTATYDCHAGFSDWHSLWSHAKQRWCCSNKFVGCPGSWHGAIAHTTHVTHVHHIHHYHSGSYPGGWHSHSWSSSDGYHPLKK